jgi:hypothetical protein
MSIPVVSFCFALLIINIDVRSLLSQINVYSKAFILVKLHLNKSVVPEYYMGIYPVNFPHFLVYLTTFHHVQILYRLDYEMLRIWLWIYFKQCGNKWSCLALSWIPDVSAVKRNLYIPKLNDFLNKRLCQRIYIYILNFINRSILVILFLTTATSFLLYVLSSIKPRFGDEL